VQPPTVPFPLEAPMIIRDILRTKGSDVVTVTPDYTVLAAMKVLVRHRIGAVMVVEDGEVRGILSERDVLRVGAGDPSVVSSVLVGEAMTHEVVVGVPDDDIDYVMEIMTQNRIRHLPIVVDGRLDGIVSIGDVVNACRKRVEAENRYLRDYIAGVVG
jgi:CBS domain-containing protein